MTARHTPGPWRADGPPHNRIVWCEGTDNRVCFMAHSDGADNERDIATSNLVAAAPLLLEALQEAVAQYGKPGGPWNVPSDPGGWIARAKDALAAATPEGPAA